MRLFLSIFLLLVSFSGFFPESFATDKTVNNVSEVPQGYTSDGTWYTKNDSSDRYKVSAGGAAAGDIQVIETSDTSGIFGEDFSASARSGDFNYTDIPKIIVNTIEYLLLLAGTICVLTLIYHALRMQISSGITGDSSHVDQAKQGMRGSLIGFALSMSAWFLMTKFVEIMFSIT